MIEAIENLLDALGYDPGRVDSKATEDTADAIWEFQKDNDIAIDGKPSAALLVSLAKAARTKIQAK